MENLFGRKGLKDSCLDGEKIEELYENIRAETSSLVILQGEDVVFERYGQGFDAYRRHYTASAAKAVVGGLSLVLAMDDGLIALDDLACQYVPQWRQDEKKSRITIRQLAAHTSLLQDADIDGVEHKDLPGWMGAFWRRESPFLLARDAAPVTGTPGSRYAYSNTGIAMLTYAVSAALKGSAYQDVRQLLWERIIQPLGFDETEWSVGYEEVEEEDGLRLVGSWGGGALSSRCMAALGVLMLRQGVWKGQRLVGQKTVQACLLHSGMDYVYGATWRINRDHRGEKIWKTLPADAYAALGAGNQSLFVIPSRDLVIVRFGDAFPGPYATALEDNFTTPLGQALRPWVVAEKSKLIQEIRWAPASRVLRLATGGATRDGSDNWPMTWGDDDALYTAYGDGYGFSPQMPSKLGLGFGKVEGTPPDLKVSNIRSDAENRLWGPNGEKASGLLMVDGKLYLLARRICLFGVP